MATGSIHVVIDRWRSVHWQKSSFSIANGECVEVAVLADGSIGVRDSKRPDGEILTFTRGEMAAFVEGVRAGEFDHLC